MDFAGSRVVVLGAGVSGRAAARFLLARGGRVDLWDDVPRERLAPDALALGEAGAGILAGGPPLETGYDLAVLSPGISVEDPRVQHLATAGTEVLGELELSARFLEAPLLAVTGTNGKTTVTHLLRGILEAAGKQVFVGGNVGTPLIEAVGRQWDCLVVEVSSFQLETVRQFHPRVAVLLNITDDHFDRHRDLDTYAAAKARIFENLGPGDAAVVNADEPRAWSVGREARGAVLPYSLERALPVGAWLEGGDAVFLLPGQDGVRVDRGAPALPGRHNLGNVLAACLAAAWMGVDPASAWDTAARFRGLPHRLETFLEWRGVAFVDDSKATNVGAAVEALATVRAPVVWVAGGVDKGGDYAPLVPLVRQRVRQAVLVGAAARRMAGALAGAAPVRIAADWSEVVQQAIASAQEGDTVLLAPACSSFDFFANYAQRGEVFQRLCRDETRRRDEHR